jgi:hypothetical protein
VVRLEDFISLLRRTLENDNHEAAHEESSVYHLLGLFRCAVVEDPIFIVVLIPQESGELPGISVYHGKIQWSEILVEGHIGQIVVNIEEKGVLVVLWGLEVTQPVKFVYKNKG